MALSAKNVPDPWLRQKDISLSAFVINISNCRDFVDTLSTSGSLDMEEINKEEVEKWEQSENKKSSVWSYFLVLKSNKTKLKCKLCQKCMIYSRSMTSFKYHLKSTHKLEVEGVYKKPVSAKEACPSVATFLKKKRI